MSHSPAHSGPWTLSCMVPSAFLPPRTAGPSTPGCGPLSPCRHRPGQGHVCGQRLVARWSEGSGQLECPGPSAAQPPPQETREDRTKRPPPLHEEVGSYDSLSAHRCPEGGAGGPARRRGQTGRPGGGQSVGRGGAQPARLLHSGQSRGDSRAGAAHGPRLGHLGVFFSPLHFPSSVTMSLTTRWLSCRNGTREGFGFVLRGQR